MQKSNYGKKEKQTFQKINKNIGKICYYKLRIINQTY